MSRIDLDEMLDRYIKGEALPEEIETIESWLNADRNPNSEWGLMNKTSRKQWTARLFHEISAGAGIGDARVIPMSRKRIFWWGITAAAAAIAVFVAVYIVRPLPNSINLPQLTILNIAAGKKTQLTLADGSNIGINSGSGLAYPKIFNGKTREVYLSGEAFFDIKHDALKPFIIHTGNVTTTVLGTAFNIKTDKLLHTVVVTVTRGKVSVANGNRPLGVITPNQQISFNTVSRKYAKTEVDTRKTIAWTDNYIHFDNITFADAAAQLQQWYKVKISFANEKIKNCRFTGTAGKEENLDKILKVICAVNNAAYKTKADGTIVIDGPGCD